MLSISAIRSLSVTGLTTKDHGRRVAALAAGLSLAAFAPAQFQFQPRIAICAAASSSSTDCRFVGVQSTLLASGRFQSCDIINVATSGTGTPTLEQLLQYDALLCWTNVTPQDNNAWGDVLADYVDAGGGVVVGVYASSTTTAGRNIGGRWQNGYEVILDQSGTTSGSTTLGTVLIPSHPLLAGLTNYSGGSRPTGTALEVGAFAVAETSDGKILVAQGPNSNRVDLGFYPPESTCSSPGWSVGGDVLLANAMRFVSDGARFGPYGAGCAGTLGVPTLAAQAGSRPVLGTTFSAEVDNLANGLAVVVVGESRDAWGALALPLDLGVVNAAGCDLLAEPAVSVPVASGAPTAAATWSIPVPGNAALIGYELFVQAFSLDLGANAFGFAGSNGGLLKVGV